MDEEKNEMKNTSADNGDCGVPASEVPGFSIIRGLITAVTVFLIIFVAIGIFKAMKASRKPPPKKPPVPRVLKVQIEETVIQPYTVTVEGQGTAMARREIMIIPEVIGKVVYAHPEFRDGGLVRKGDLLFRIEQDDYSESVSQAGASVSALENEIVFQEAQRETLKKQLARAKDSWAISHEEAERVKRLFEQGASSEAEVNGRLAQEKANMERVEQLESSLALVDPGIERVKSNLAASEAMQAKAKLARARTEYRAPFSGRITGGKLDAGQYIGAGKSLARLIDDSVYEIPIPLSVSNWQALAPGVGADNLVASPVSAEVVFRDDEGRPHSIEGEVVRLGSELDMKTRLVDVVVEIHPGAGDIPIIPGMFCSVVFRGQTLENVVVIPRRALRADDTVYLAQEKKTQKTITRAEMEEFAGEFAGGEARKYAAAAADDFELAIVEKFGYELKPRARNAVKTSLGQEVAGELESRLEKALDAALAAEFPEGADEIKVETVRQTLLPRKVVVWRHEGEEIVIAEGLEEGDSVITSVVEEVVPGMPVVVISRNGENMVPDAKAGEFGGASEGGSHEH